MTACILRVWSSSAGEQRAVPPHSRLAMAKVTLRNIQKVYCGKAGRQTVAVKDFDLEVQDREFVVLVGPSGCGKTTTLRMIAGLEEISGGEIEIDGKRMNDIPPKDRDLAMVFQNYALYPHMSVEQNLAFGLQLRRHPKEEITRRVREAATILGIETLLGRRPADLSGGQRQRVALGRAIVRQPKVFLFDEPLSNLDAKMRVQMRTELTKLHQRLRATMIYVTHDQIEAMTMGDRIVVMREGVIQQIDSPLVLYRDPSNLFVAGFLGSPPMNFISGKLKESSGGLVFKEAEGGVIECKLEDRPAARQYVGKEVILGLRPEDILLHEGADRPPGLWFQALIDVIEPMGPDTNYYLQTGAHVIVCRNTASADSNDGGHRIRFQIKVQNAHLFDPASTMRIA